MKKILELLVELAEAAYRHDGIDMYRFRREAEQLIRQLPDEPDTDEQQLKTERDAAVNMLENIVALLNIALRQKAEPMKEHVQNIKDSIQATLKEIRS